MAFPGMVALAADAILCAAMNLLDEFEIR